jgi:quinoprotein glucose dehydrogenase
MERRRTICGIATLLLVASPALAVPPPAEQKPDWSKQRQAASGFVVGEGMKVELFAAEPMVKNPVAICLDEKGRVFVAETFRQNKGVDDNRARGYWLLDDLASKRVEDRLLMYEKWKQRVPMTYYTTREDRVRRLEDRDGDGVADHATIFSDHYNAPLDGTGAGLIARDGNVYFTCIPKLYRLPDANDDGVADRRETLVDGFGVRVALRGHDLHGLVWGPDGKLYFSIGDRGYHVTTPDGKVHTSPGSGAVFRCNPDGSDFGVFAHGLRNPQELAFDQYGNLFAADNNSDVGDRARIVYVCEGGETGWNMSYQTLDGSYSRGPWNMDKLWHKQHKGQAAWILPPIEHIGSGPSGFTYYPGVGLSERYVNHLFMCDFRGGAGNSAVYSFACEPQGAGMKVIDNHAFLSGMLVTDVEFGYDGRVYLSDWINGWDGMNAGRIYTLHDKKEIKNPLVAEVKQTFAQGFKKLTTEKLASLLAHADMRMRLRAQYELAGRGAGSAAVFHKIAADQTNQLVRLHAVWGLGMLARADAKVLAGLIPLLQDADVEVRCQTSNVLGDHRVQAAAAPIAKLLADDNLRVRYFAAMALGKLRYKPALDAVLAVLAENADRDVFLRHGCVMYLTGLGDADAVLAQADHKSPSVRMAVVLTLRRLKDARIAKFLKDSDDLVAREAAIAINDLPIARAMPALAAALNRDSANPSFLRRAINANFRLGKPGNAQALVEFIAHVERPEAMRVEAIQALADWAAPSPRDRVLGFHRPLPERNIAMVSLALQSRLSEILKNSKGNATQEATRLASKLNLKPGDTDFSAWVADAERPIGPLIFAFWLLESKNDSRLNAIVAKALSDREPLLRAEAVRVLAKSNAAQALVAIGKALKGDSVVEKQAAIDTLATMDSTADPVLAGLLRQLLDGSLDAPLRLDLLEAAGTRKDARAKQLLAQFHTSQSQTDPLAPFRATLYGGDAERGKKIFFGHSQTQCMRCHTIDKQGGDAGPDLSKVSGMNPREYLLESIVAPSAKIAKGFETVMIVTDDGKVVSGVLKSETATHVHLADVQGKPVAVAKSSIDERRPATKSSMPEGLTKLLTKRELRDLIEFLSQQK